MIPQDIIPHYILKNEADRVSDKCSSVPRINSTVRRRSYGLGAVRYTMMNRGRKLDMNVIYEYEIYVVPLGSTFLFTVWT